MLYLNWKSPIGNHERCLAAIMRHNTVVCEHGIARWDYSTATGVQQLCTRSTAP
ncbi:hypothetical protein [Paenibacillus ihumii]|uniref:hypothetical protein n=1 Tax=Paenibacillus ihumii TaxID=687436 RepID=UPI000AFD2397|nr:hypothetical protein [Paenibacillus ihumii]